MRARNLKPTFFKNPDLADAGPIAQVLFAGLWCLADKEGRLKDQPRVIKAEVFPYYDADVNGELTKLERLGFIRRYVASGVGVIEVRNFKKHQSPHHTEKASDLPAYQPEKPKESDPRESHREHTVKSPLRDGGNRSDSLTPDSLTPDSLNHESGKQNARAPERIETVSQATQSTPVEHLVAPAVNVEALEEWRQHRAAKGKPLQPHELIVLGKTLASWGKPELQLVTVRNCIANGWLNLRQSDGRPAQAAALTAEQQAGRTAWDALIASDGAKRDPRVQHALDAIGGWLAVKARNDFTGPRLRDDFVRAYVNAEVAA